MEGIEFAKQLIEQGQYARAVDTLRKLVARDGSNTEAWYTLGTLYYGLQQPDQAESAFQQALRVEPTHANAHFYLGEISANRGDRTAAIQHYSAAVAANPGHRSATERLSALLSPTTNINLDPGGPPRSAGSPAPVSPGPATAPPETLRPPRTPSSWTRSVVGVVENLQYHTEPYGRSMNARTIYNFRLQVVNEKGQKQEIVGVELRGLGFKGGINNGDWVEIDRYAKRRGEAFELNELRNLTTGGEVKGTRFRF
jgi:tetratricopeptide (TPR) repeat protein